MFRFLLTLGLLLSLPAPKVSGQSQQKMPRENVVEIPAIGEGLCVSNVFQSNMVLQRDKPISIWGWATPGESITVSFSGHTQTTTAADDRTWKAVLPAVPTNTAAQLLTVKGSESTLTLDNILVGDVWVLGGQSNMEFPLDRIENGQLEIVSANYPNIRILTVPAQNGPNEKPGFSRLHEWSGWFGRHYRKGDWDVCSPDVVRELSAIGYVFARRIHMASQIPIGVIDASRGGTTVETWTPDPVLRKLDSQPLQTVLAEWDQKVADYDAQADLDNRIKNYQQKAARFEKEGRQLPASEKQPTDLRPGPALDQNRPGNCYASMIAPIAGLQIKGAIFHQGYNNCFNGTEGSVLYRHVFPKMIASWRAAFGNPSMPFGILSLCTEGPVQTLDNYSEMMSNPGPYIREAQYQTFLELYNAGDRNIGFTSTYDLRRRWYHPQLKIPAGERIARWALATQYGFDKDVQWKPPMLTQMTAEDGRLLLTMDQAVEGVDNGGPILGFAVAGEDRRFHPANAAYLETGRDDRGRPKVDKTTLVLSSPMVPRPVQYRYAWGRSPLGNLQTYRMSDVPFATQRSDDWTLESTPLGVLDGDASSKLDRGQRRKLQEALQELDRSRARFHAKKLLEEN